MIYFFIPMVFILFLSTHHNTLHAAHNKEKWGIITVPVADLVLLSYGNLKKNPHEEYKKICHAPQPPYLDACPRYRQMLYLEQVRIKVIHKDEASIETPKLIRYNTKTRQYDSDAWTLSSNIVSLDELRARAIDYQKLIPSKENLSLTLITPWHNNTTGITYSAGTHFVYSKVSNNGYHAYSLAQNPWRIEEIIIPATVALPLKKQTPQSARALFLEILRSWCSPHQQTQGVVPYIWGGSSFTKRYAARAPRREGNQWFDDSITDFPAPGCDCSGLIYLIAHRIAGMENYLFSNTSTLVHELTEVTDIKKLKEGDLIWFPGHVMIVDSLKNNTLIHAQGSPYEQGYLRRVTLNEIFSNVSSFADFLTLKKEKKAHKYLHLTKQTFKLLDLTSAFNKKSSF